MRPLAIALAAGIAAFYLIEALRYAVRRLRWLPRHERRARRAAGLCPGCGYDLRGNVSGRCPECGAPVPAGPAGRDRGDALRAVADGEAPSLFIAPRPWWVWAAVLGTMLLALALEHVLRSPR